MSFIGKMKELIYKRYHAYQVTIIRKSFCEARNHQQQARCPGTLLYPLTDFEYKNESWEPIRHLNDLLMAAAKHKTLELNDNVCLLSDRGEVKGSSLFIHSARQPNTWMCFFYKHPLGNRYVFEFDIVIHDEFKEIQVAFRMKDLANRCRFMIRDNKEAVFEVVKDGWFHKHIFTKPYSLQPGTRHHFKIIVDDNKFGFHIDNEELFCIKQRLKIKSLGNGLCLILYNESALRNIDCEITNMRISNL